MKEEQNNLIYFGLGRRRMKAMKRNACNILKSIRYSRNFANKVASNKLVFNYKAPLLIPSLS